MKKRKVFPGFFVLLLFLLCACGRVSGTEEDRLIRVGFSQLGSESDWRAANTKCRAFRAERI